MYVRASTEELLADGGGAGPPAADFTVPNGTHELVIPYTVNCTDGTAGHWEIILAPTQSQGPQDDAIQISGDCPGSVEAEHVSASPTEGTWAYAAVYAGQTGGAPTRQVSVLARTYTESSAA